MKGHAAKKLTHSTKIQTLVTRGVDAFLSSLLLLIVDDENGTLAISLLLPSFMRRRNPHDKMATADYASVSQDPENPGTSKRGIMPRSYNARRRLTLLAICGIVALGVFAAVRFFESSGEKEEGMRDCREDTIVGVVRVW